MQASRVAKVELFHVAIPLPATFRPAWIPGMPANENRFTLVRVTTDDGVEGYSAGPAIGRERAGLGDVLGPYLLGEDATDIALIQQRLREISYLGWRNWWIEPAFWDIKGKIEAKPVCELLSGKPCTVRLYASTGEVKEPGERIEEVEARDGILEEPFDHDRGTLETPTSPGLGFAIDRRALARWGKRFFVMDRKRLIWFSLRHRGIKASKEIDRARRERAEG
jgi:L-alanine-DL-glutamate epimerase-like enolase superfamily enzyme